MVAIMKQVELGGLDEEREEQAEIEAGYLWREQLWSAMRTFVAGYIDARTGAKGYDGVAAALDRRWGPKGRPVSASALRSALHDVERNNFRAEWLDWFAARDGDIANLMARRVKPEKTDREMFEDLIATLREEFPKQADKLERKARAR
jgi:hypothetical protein